VSGGIKNRYLSWLRELEVSCACFCYYY